MLQSEHTNRFSIHWMLRWMMIAWIVTKMLSFNLWTANRTFPLVPVLDILEKIPGLFQQCLFFFSLAAMATMFFLPGKKLALSILLAECLLCLFDLNRWQPWEYQFLFMLGVYSFAGNRPITRLNWQVIIIGLYFFSGFFKLNSGYTHDTWQNLVLQKWLGINNIPLWLLRAGYMNGMIEILAAVGLLFSTTRKWAVLILVLMHVFILLLLGPTGLNLNNVVWPWNILMPVLLIGLFNEPGKILSLPDRHSYKLAIVCVAWLILPFFHMKGFWDKYLSFALYSGGTEHLYICPCNHIPEEIKKFEEPAYSILPCKKMISLYNWGMKELNVVPYPELRNYRAIAKKIDQKIPEGNKYYLFKTGFRPEWRRLK